MVTVMNEMPAEFNARLLEEASWSGPRYPADDLARYSYHTGAPLRRLAADEACPVLFRDVGPAALAQFLRGQLRRLAGPYTPVTYLRTAAYREPYTDYEKIGRLIFLRPLLLHPWHSGVADVYVARATRTADPATVGFIPGEVGLELANRLVADLRHTSELREVLGGRRDDEAAAETLHRLEVLAADLAATEKRAEPLRQGLQSPDRRRRETARAEMERLGITEDDLCAAWHHLPRERRAWVREALAQVSGEVVVPRVAGVQ
jgi:hypothetical protein